MQTIKRQGCNESKIGERDEIKQSNVRQVSKISIPL